MGEPYQGSPINSKIINFNEYHNFIFTIINFPYEITRKLILVNIKL